MQIPVDQYRELIASFSNDISASHIISLAQTPFNDTYILADNNAVTSAEFNVYTTINDTDNVLIVPHTNATALSANATDFANANIKASNRTALVVAGKPRFSTEMPIWLIPCYSIILFFAIIGNLLVISTLVQNRRMRTITNLFLLNLAISDMLLGVFCMPVTLVGTLLRHFIFGEIFCKLIQFSQAASVAVSSWTLVAISCERYYAICHPLRSRTWQTINHAYRIIGFIWFGSVVCMTPIALFSQLIPTSRQGFRKCREQWPVDSLAYERSYNLFLDLVLLVLPLLILSFAYILITRTLYVGMKNERAMIFGSVAPTAPVGGSGSSKLGNEVDTLTTALVPSTTAGAKKASRFQFNVSFRVRGCSASGMVACQDFEVKDQQQNFIKKSKSHARQSQQQPLQEQQKQHTEQRQSCCDDIASTHTMPTSSTNHKRKLLTATNERRHLYYMETASSMKSLNHNNNDRNGRMGGSSTSPSASMTVINVPQQQRFKLNQQRHQSQQQLQLYIEQDIERSKSTSTPSLRLNDTALRRSNKTKSLESKKRVIKMLFVLVLEFFICWTPLYVINTVAMFIGPSIYEYVDYTSISFFQLLAYSSSCCNPITYCFMNAGFRRAFLDTFKGLQLFRRKSSSNHSVAGNSIIMANSGTMLTTNSVLDSPRL